MKILLLLGILMAGPVLASTVLDTSCKSGGCCSMSADDILKRCEDPHTYNRQIPPNWIKIICRAKCMEWERLPGAQTYTLPMHCMGSATIRTSKRDCGKERWEPLTAQSVFSCYDLGRFKKTKNLSLTLSCEEYKEIADDVESYCAMVLDGVPEDIVATGETKTTCPDSPVAQKPPTQRGRSPRRGGRGHRQD